MNTMQDKDPSQPGYIDPLRRVFVHNEPRFKTHDGVYYVRPRGDSDQIRRQIPKVRGKKARRADKEARRKQS